VYVLYGWKDGPSFERKKTNVPWKGEIVIMLKHNLEVHFGPTFSAYFVNNFYRDPNSKCLQVTSDDVHDDNNNDDNNNNDDDDDDDDGDVHDDVHGDVDVDDGKV
jgi:hypothetical protein